MTTSRSVRPPLLSNNVPPTESVVQNEPHPSRPPNGPVIGVLVGVGALVGVVLGAVTGQWGVWMPVCIGVAVALAFGFHFQRRR